MYPSTTSYCSADGNNLAMDMNVSKPGIKQRYIFLSFLKVCYFFPHCNKLWLTKQLLSLLAGHVCLLMNTEKSLFYKSPCSSMVGFETSQDLTLVH